MGKFIRNIFTKNLETKIFALLLSIIVWTYLSFTTTETYETSARIQIKNREAFNGIFNLSTLRNDVIQNKIRIIITGPRKDIKIIRQKELICNIQPQVDHEKNEIQQIIYTIKEKDFNLYEFNNIQINVIPEQEIRIEYIPFVEKNVQILYPDPLVAQNIGEAYDIEIVEKPQKSQLYVPMGEEEKLLNKLRLFGGVPVKSVIVQGEGAVSIPLSLDLIKFGSNPHIEFKENPVLKLSVHRKPVEIIIHNIPIKLIISNKLSIKEVSLSETKSSVTILVKEEEKDLFDADDILCYCEIDVSTDFLKGSELKITLPVKAVVNTTKTASHPKIKSVIPKEIDVEIKIPQ